MPATSIGNEIQTTEDGAGSIEHRNAGRSDGAIRREFLFQRQRLVNGSESGEVAAVVG